MTQLKNADYNTGLHHAAHALAASGRPDSAVEISLHLKQLNPSRENLSLFNRLTRPDGISIIMPTYKGVDRIGNSLASVARQSLDSEKFELIIIQNGPEDGTDRVISEFSKQHPHIAIQRLTSHPNGASQARNTGLKHARFNHVTFLDDDDYLSDPCLEKALAQTDGDAVVFVGLKDDDGKQVASSHVYENLIAAFGQDRRIRIEDAGVAGTALTMTCIKVFPTYMAENFRFDTRLKNGEDVVFWSHILSHFDPELVLCPPADDAVYYRTLRESSVSRQPPSFQFSVKDRVAVIRALDDIPLSPFILQKIHAALSFTVHFLNETPTAYRQTVNYIRSQHLKCENEVLEYLNGKLAKNLCVSFCFPPWNDTAGIVAAKRIRHAASPTDVISANMGKVRPADKTLEELKKPFVGKHIELELDHMSFSHPDCIIEFTEKAVKRYTALERNKQYETMYSRAMWPASHFAAAAIKITRPDLFWSAEFSDPLRLDIFSKERPGDISRSWLEEIGILPAIAEKHGAVIETDATFVWAEYVAYALADEIMFTNENQRDYMLAQDWVQDFRKDILQKSVIRHHPVPSRDMYKHHNPTLSPALPIDKDRTNIAYFGNFYKTRGLEDLLSAMAALPSAVRSRLAFHVFTSDPDQILQAAEALNLNDVISAHSFVPYFEFLSLCRLFDVLLVNDTRTLGIKPTNPYLPSKISDYLGSGARIWALVEPGSPMDGLQLPPGSIKSPLGDAEAYMRDITTLTDTI